MPEPKRNRAGLPELLAPAGGWESFLAAINNGADAVYLGMNQFNARQSAENFDADLLARALEYAHIRRRRVYVTMNTLLLKDEIGPALELAHELHDAGADAIIVQDLGLLRGLRTVLPAMRVHASTQMTLHNIEGVKFAASQGIRRVVLARELEARHVAAIRDACRDVELEVFVHGALCYCYSGQCLFSSVVGGRSGNRGRCAQPCRLAYTMTDASGEKLRGHLLSPADLCLLDRLPSLIEAGVDSLKIEGRMKRPEYVATVTRVYRNALDQMMDKPDEDEWVADPEAINQLSGIFNRRFTVCQWSGRNRSVLSIQRPNNRGVSIGRVSGVEEGSNQIQIRLTHPLRCGDGIEIWVSRGPTPGGVVEKLSVNGKPVDEAKAWEEAIVFVPGRAPAVGDRIFRTHDRDLIEQARETLDEGYDGARIPITAAVTAKAGEPVIVTFTDDEGSSGTARSDALLVRAFQRPTGRDDVQDKIGRIGNTPYRITAWELELENDLMIPFKALNETRRLAIEDLTAHRLGKIQANRMAGNEFWARKQGFLDSLGPARKAAQPIRLSVRVSGINAARAALAAGADRVYVSLHGFYGFKPLALAQEAMELPRNGRQELFFQLPVIARPGEAIRPQELSAFSCNGVLVGEIGAAVSAEARYGMKVQADYTINCFNPHTANELFNDGVSGVCLSPELNLEQLVDFRGLSNLEYLVHGPLPVMVSEHCVRGNVEQAGCAGCKHARQVIEDEKGYSFPMLSDGSCRQHIWNSRTTCLVEEIPALIRAGISLLRIEAVLAGPEQVAGEVRLYRQALDACVSDQLSSLGSIRDELEKLAASPLTKLHLFRGVQA